MLERAGLDVQQGKEWNFYFCHLGLQNEYLLDDILSFQFLILCIYYSTFHKPKQIGRFICNVGWRLLFCKNFKFSAIDMSY